MEVIQTLGNLKS